MDRRTKICTIGGGSGMPVVNAALVKAGYEDIHSIVTTFDSGGDTGRMRTDERGRILAYSDYWRALISLWKDGEQKEKWREMLKFRDGRGRNFGNMFFQFMTERVGDLSEVDSLFSKLTGANIMGEVVPVSLESADLCFNTRSGKVYKGENYLDEHRMSQDMVKEVWLSRKVRANPEAIKTIKEAELMVICPGSMYGSIIINLLPDGISGAFKKSKGKKVLMTNVMSVRNENDGFSQEEYVHVFEKYLKCRKIFDLVLMADLKCLEEKLMKRVYKNYKLEYARPLKLKKNDSMNTIVADIATIDEKNLRLRHDEDKLAFWFRNLTW